MADPVELTDLDVIARFSLAVRSATADRAEVIEALQADLDWLQRGARPRPAPAPAPAQPAAPASPRSTRARRSDDETRSAAKKATARLRKA